MAPHSSTLAWKIPWTEEPGRVPSMGLQRVRHVRATSLSLFTLMHWRRNYNPLQCSCLENPRDGRSWWAAVYEVTQNRTRLRRLSSSSSSSSFCIAKETINKMKRQLSGWEKIFAKKIFTYLTKDCYPTYTKSIFKTQQLENGQPD